MFGSTLDDRNRLYIGTSIQKSFSFFAFASEKVINLIREFILPHRRRYLIDGTFKVVPRTFYQLIVVSVEYEGDVRMRFMFSIFG